MAAFPAVSALPGARYFGPARVVLVDEAEARIRVHIETHGEDAWARNAISGAPRIAAGDEVLIAGEARDELYVVGLLAPAAHSGATAVGAASERLELGHGAFAELEGSTGAPKLRVFSPRNELLFEYDAASEKARITVESGDMEFATTSGDIAFRSAGKLRFAGRDVDVCGRQSARVSVVDPKGKSVAGVCLEPGSLDLSSPEVAMTAQRGLFNLQETRYAGAKLFANVGQIKLVAVKLESSVRTLVEKAKNVYKTVEQLTQLKTGRMRTFVAKTFHLKSNKAMLKSEQDFKVRGEHIHLG